MVAWRLDLTARVTRTHIIHGHNQYIILEWFPPGATIVPSRSLRTAQFVYQINRVSPSLVQVDCTGSLTTTDVDAVINELQSVIGDRTHQRVHFKGGQSGPADIASTRHAGERLRTLTGVDKFALSGATGVKVLIGRMLLRFAGKLPFEMQLFAAEDEALSWLAS